MANINHCSSSPSQPSSSNPTTLPPNAFTPEFLKALEATDMAQETPALSVGITPSCLFANHPFTQPRPVARMHERCIGTPTG